MAKQKKHYEVYYVGRGSGCYAKEYFKKFIGEVWAVSEAQACNFVRYRNRDNYYKNGGYATQTLGDCLDEGFVEFKYEAREID